MHLRTATRPRALRELGGSYPALIRSVRRVLHSSGTILLAGLGPGTPTCRLRAGREKGEQSVVMLECRRTRRSALDYDRRRSRTWPACREASEQAVQIFERSRMESVTAVMEEIMPACGSTRGSAVAVAEDTGRCLNFSGLGNISGAIHSPGRPSIWCLITEQRACRRESLRSSHMSFDRLDDNHAFGRFAYPVGIWIDIRAFLRRHPAVVAGTLYRDFSRGSDDVTVLVVSQ